MKTYEIYYTNYEGEELNCWIQATNEEDAADRLCEKHRVAYIVSIKEVDPS